MTRSRRSSWGNVVLAAVALGMVVLAPASAFATSPVQPEVVGCEPVFLGAASDSSCSGTGAGNATPAVPCATDADCVSIVGAVCGIGGSCVDRVFNLYFVLRTENKTDVIADALAATTCIDICYENVGQPVGTPPTCPGDSWCNPPASGSPDPAGKPWVVYDKAHGIGDLSNVTVFQDPANLNSDLELTWTLAADASLSPRGYTVRTNAANPAAAAPSNGSCLNWQKLADDGAANPRFEVWASQASQLADLTMDTSAIHPFGPGIDVCKNGSRVSFASGLITQNEECATTAQATFLATFFDAIDDAQQLRLQKAIPAANRHHSWTNGTVGGVCQPTRVQIGAHPGGWGQAGTGAFHMNGPETTGLVPNADPTKVVGGDDLYRLAPHEYLHQLQGKWSADKPNASAFINSVAISENTADLVSYHLCLPTLTGPGSTSCWSGVKLTSPATTEGDANVTYFEKLPNTDLLYKPYASAAIFHYISEQFAYPKTSAPHPSGDDSTLPRPPGLGAPEGPLATGNNRASDEGMDFMGLMFRDFEGATNGQTVESAIDASLQSHLGRSLADVAFDFHTALYLKDYNNKDVYSARWRFEWVGDGNAASPLESLKPFFPPQAKPLVDPQPDGHFHAYRVLDDWVTCAAGVDPVSGCAGLTSATRTTLMLNQGFEGSVPVGLTTRAGAAFSVHPDVAWVGKGPVGVGANGKGPKPRFRLFRIRTSTGPGGKTLLTPEPLCGSAPNFECTTIAPADGSAGWMLSEAVSVDATTDEILLVASAGSPSVFNWSIGTISPKVTILEPTTVTPTFIGAPGGASGVLPFLIEATYRDANGLPVNVTQSTSVQVNVSPCATAPTCTVPADHTALLPLSGGSLFVTVSLPNNFYPATLPIPKLVDLELVLDGVSSGTMPKALKMSQDTALFADTIVIDKSGSMAEENGAKIASARLISKAIAGALVPVDPAQPGSHQLSIVTFNDDADTLPLGANGTPFVTVDATSIADIQQKISAIQAGGFTSIGDGVFEAQSNLACAFDNAMTKPDGQSMVVLTDGLNNRDADPSIYYSGDQGIPSGDGNGTWCTQPLSIPLRKGKGLPVPTITAIGIGQDADLSALTNLAAIGGGAVLYVADPGAIPNIQNELVLHMGDSMFAGVNHAHGTQRLFAGALNGSPTGPTQFPVEAGAQELRVVVSGIDFGDADLAILVPPAGSSPTIHTTRVDNSIVLKVQNPPAGTWAVLPYAPEQTLFVEAAVESTTRMFGFANVSDVPTLPAGVGIIKAANIGQDDIYLRAVVMGAGPMTGCVVNAAVANPAGAVTLHSLKDDGTSFDGGLNDGVYGNRYASSPLPGIYDVLFAAICTTQDGHTIWRQDRRSFVLQAGGDADGDGLPDVWEKAHGLNPNSASDALSDPDHDGLTNLQEFAATTDPHKSDTDGGGESDGSEVAANRDPRDPSDDKIKPPSGFGIGGLGKIFLHLAGNFSLYDLIVEKRLADGTFDPNPVLVVRGGGRTTGADTSGGLLVAGDAVTSVTLDGVPNGVASCYRIRAAQGDILSGWSEPTCATPALDPNPPSVLGTGRIIAHSRQVTLPIIATDELPHHVRALNLPLGVQSSGVSKIRIGLSPTASDGAWTPFTTSVRLPDSITTGVWVQVQDGSGNLSEAAFIPVTRFPMSILDQAIALEESAQDQSSAQAWSAARSSIAASIPKLAHAIEEVLEKHPPKAIAKHATEAVAIVLEHKALALAFMDAKHHAKADSELAAALAIERDLAAWADANGVTFAEQGP